MRLYNKKQLQVFKATSKDETRPALNGVLFEENKVVATDGHRLVVVENKPMDEKDWPVNGVNWNTDNNDSFIVNRKSIEKAIKNIPKSKGRPILENVAIGLTEKGKATLQTTDLEHTDNIVTETAEGRFPDYKLVLPDVHSKKTEYKSKVAVNAKYMKEAFELMGNLTDESGNVQIHIKDQNSSIVLTCEDQDNNKTTAVIMPMRMDK